MEHLAALVGFSFVSAVTPGPNNVILWASGAAFGLRRTAPHILGTAVGLGVMALAVAGGLGAVVTTVPELGFAMKVTGSTYLLYLAVRIARMRSVEATDLTRPMGVVEAGAFQLINPKAWVFALGAVTTFRPPDQPVAVGSVLVAATMAIVIVPSATLWAVGGDMLGRFIGNERWHHVVALVLAGIVAATVVLVWI